MADTSACNWFAGALTNQTFATCATGITIYNSAITCNASSYTSVWTTQVQTAFLDSGTAIWGAWTTEVVKRKETKKQHAARLLREQAAQDAAVARQSQLVKEQAEARARARKLLVEHLNEAQRKTLEAAGYFDVEVGKKTYRIRNGTHGNVRLLEKGVEKTSYCIQPPGVPDGDAMLAQKLHLETNEAEFLRIANATQLAAQPF